MRVLVTRPEPGASRTAERLSRSGFEPVLLPLTRIVALKPEIAANDAALVAATSANAFRHADQAALGKLAHLPCMVVGHETASAARDAGFDRVEIAGPNGTALADRLVASSHPDRAVLYLCGRVRRPDFEHALASAGVRVTPLETYDTLAIDYPEAELSERLGGEPIPVALVFSAEAGIALARLATEKLAQALLLPQTAICISQRVAATLAAAGFRTETAAEPTEVSILSALRDISSAQP